MSCGGFEGIGDEFDRLAEVPCREVAGMVFVLLEGSDIDGKVAGLVGAIRDDVAGYDI